MRKMMILLILMSLLLVGVTSVGAIGDAVGNPQQMAQLFPADTALFFSMRTDEGFFDQIDSFGQLAGTLPGQEDMANLTMRQLIEESLAGSGFNLDQIFGILGNYVAVGLSNIDVAFDDDFSNDEDFILYAALMIDDRAAVESLLDEQMTGSETKETMGDFTVYRSMEAAETPVTLAIGDSYAYMTVNTSAMPGDGPTLADDARFQSAVNALPADNYNIVAYADMTSIITGSLAMAQGADLEALAMLGFSPDQVGPLAIGFTILDGYTLVIDTAQPAGAAGGSAATSVVNPDFARFIPSNASASIHVTDLTGLYNTFMGLLREIARSEDQPDPSLQINGALAMLGIDLEEDLLSWTTGDYAIFGRLDTQGLVVPLANNDLNISGTFDFGLIIEATDSAKAQAFAGKLRTLVTMMLGNQAEEISVSTETMGGFDVTVIGIEAPLGPGQTFALDILIGANDDVFFLATRDAVAAMMAGDGGLVTNPAYTEALGYVLPNATSVLYADADGLVMSAAIPVGILTLLGPTIGNIFDNIVDELDDGIRAPQSTTVTVQNQDPTAELLEQVEAVLGLISSSSISATVTDDGTTLFRIVMTYNAP